MFKNRLIKGSSDEERIIFMIKEGFLGVDEKKIQETYNQGVQSIQNFLLKLYEKLKTSKRKEDFPRSEKKLFFSENSKRILELLSLPKKEFNSLEFEVIKNNLNRSILKKNWDYWFAKIEKINKKINNSKIYSQEFKQEINFSLMGLKAQSNVFNLLTKLNQELLNYMNDKTKIQTLKNEIELLKSTLQKAIELNGIELNRNTREENSDNVSQKIEREISEAEEKTKLFNKFVKEYIEDLNILVKINLENLEDIEKISKEFKTYLRINDILKRINTEDDSLIKEEKEAIIAEKEKIIKFLDDYGSEEVRRIFAISESKIKEFDNLFNIFEMFKKQNEISIQALEKKISSREFRNIDRKMKINKQIKDIDFDLIGQITNKIGGTKL